MYLALNVTDTTQQSEGVVQIIYTEPREMMYQNKHEQVRSPVHEVRFKHQNMYNPYLACHLKKYLTCICINLSPRPEVARLMFEQALYLFEKKKFTG